MQIIEELEPSRRGIYAGAVGYFDSQGSMDFCIAIRTIVMRPGEAIIQAGAGIVADSDPEREWEEICNKARILFRAVGVREAAEVRA
jgi:anthranilate synthase component 1